MASVQQRVGTPVPHRLARPRLRSGLVERHRLLERLCAGAHEPAVLVSAGAGYGKTTILAQWEAREERPFAWVCLDPGADDAAEVFRAIALALDAAAGLPPDLLPRLNVSRPALGRVVIPEIAAALADGPGLVLVLDDYHFVRSAPTHEAVAALVEWLPERCQVAVATRVDPMLPVGRWRARGQLVEIRAADLAFDEVEAGAMLAAAGVDLDEEDLSVLVARTEGWAAGLYLATPLLRRAGDPAEVVRHFAGDHRHVVEYLGSEGLAELGRPTKDFLAQTSVLRRLSAPLCDAVVGRRGGAEELERLERSNLFLISVGDGSGWYRYHHLFADLLLAELRRTDPDLEPELHRRAAAWLARHGDAEEAVHHAIAAADWATAVSLAADAWAGMVAAGRIDPFLAWLDRIPEAELAAFPPLAVCAAQAAMLGGQGRRALAMLALAEGSDWAGAVPLGSTTLESAVAQVRARLGPDGVSGIRRDAERVLVLEPAGSPARPIAHAMLGLSLLLSDREAEAREEVSRALALWGDTAPNPALAALAVSGLLAHRMGDVAEAERATGEARRRADALGLGDAPATALIAMSRAHVLAEAHRIGPAVIEAEDALRLLPGTAASPWGEILVRVVVAPVLAIAGQGRRAERLLAEAREIASRWPDAGSFPNWIAEAEARVRAASHDALEQALHEREREILTLLAGPLSMREIGRRLYLSVNTVKTYNLSLFRKLGVSSRAEAVERARAIGLIAEEAAEVSPG